MMYQDREGDCALMDPQQNSELDALIAAVDAEHQDDDSASPDETDDAIQETAESDGQPQGDADDVDEDADDGSDDEEPETGSWGEVNVADMTPIQASAPQASQLSEMAELRRQVNELQGFQTQAQQNAEQAEFRAFLASLGGKDPDEVKDLVSQRIAHDYMALKRQNADRDQKDAQDRADKYEKEQRAKAIEFVANGGRRQETPQGVKYMHNPKVALTDREKRLLTNAVNRGLDPMGMEEMANDLVRARLEDQATKRATKQRTDAKKGASRTLAGAGAAKAPVKQYGSGEAALDNFLDDLFE